MPSSVNAMGIGQSGLFASRSALATTGHNIANVNTEGFSRQRLEQDANKAVEVGGRAFGAGVRVSGVRRMNDEFLGKQINNEMRFLGQYEEKEVALAQAENIFNEITNDGMNRLIARFFNEFRKLGNEPESEALRATVREAAQQLIGDFRRISRSIQDIQKNIDVRIDSNVRQANELCERISHLNGEIKRNEARGVGVPDLSDQRDRCLERLATIMDVSVSNNEKNELTITAVGIGPLVSGQLHNRIYVEKSMGNPEEGIPHGSFDIKVENIAKGTVTHRIKNGKLSGLVEARDTILGDAAKRINELAYTLATRFNQIHEIGYAMTGSTGVSFFKPPHAVYDAAETLSINDEIIEDANNIATALDPDSPGDNRLVQLISRLQHEKIMEGGLATFDDFYNSTVANLATVSQRNRHVHEHQAHIVDQMKKIRESVSGVSLDEETTNLVQFQHAFNASAKVIQIADELMDEVLRIKR